MNRTVNDALNREAAFGNKLPNSRIAFCRLPNPGSRNRRTTRPRQEAGEKREKTTIVRNGRGPLRGIVSERIA